MKKAVLLSLAGAVWLLSGTAVCRADCGLPCAAGRGAFVLHSNASQEKEADVTGGMTKLEENGYTVFINQPEEFSLEETYTYQEGLDWDWRCWDVHLTSAFVETENGYCTRIGDYIYFCSFENEVMLPLCGRPDCLHDKETDPEKQKECTAYVPFGTFGEQLVYYDGKLYANMGEAEKEKLSQEMVFGDRLAMLDTDGSSKTEWDVTLEESYGFVMHRGSVYYTSQQTDPDTLEVSETVYRMDIGTKQKTVLVRLEGEASAMPSIRVYPYGDYVYINILLAKDPEVPRLIYDINSGKTMVDRGSWQERIVPDQGNDFLLYRYVEDHIQQVETVSQDRSRRETIGELVLSGLDRFGFAADASAVLYESWITADDTYFYAFAMVDGAEAAAIFDRESCELLQVIPLEGRPPYQCLGADDTYLFYGCSYFYSEENCVYWIKKEDMLNPGARFSKLEP